MKITLKDLLKLIVDDNYHIFLKNADLPIEFPVTCIYNSTDNKEIIKPYLNNAVLSINVIDNEMFIVIKTDKILRVA